MSILLLIPYPKNAVFPEFLQQSSLTNTPFDKINLSEIILAVFIALPSLYYFVIGLVCLVSNLNYSALIKDININNYFVIFLYISWGFFLWMESQRSGLIFNNFFACINWVDLKLILAIVAIRIAFGRGFNSLTLYNLSFVFPNYVEAYINQKNFTNISEMISYSLGSMALAPLFEEFFFRGIVLQKWAIKWRVRTGILSSSMLFAICHFRYDIITLLIAGTLYSILYFKSRNLIIPILCHSFHNTLVTIFDIVDYFSTSVIKRSTLISVKDYQASVQPLLGQQVFLIAISAPFLIYFLYKNFPRNDTVIPYYANDARTNEAYSRPK